MPHPTLIAAATLGSNTHTTHVGLSNTAYFKRCDL
jgi:hypothetical protein